ncbi:hypothetical protein P245_12310 [Comamonas thiooxydans]|uniref:Uncharacterized protein n=1 Tax=Comamonas thiooxydans TaxID=363952 RepID=A0A0E3BEJ8_9BURK|nr:hypothetical protein P245_12310 [Comamonas thiooxydans]
MWCTELMKRLICLTASSMDRHQTTSRAQKQEPNMCSLSIHGHIELQM